MARYPRRPGTPTLKRLIEERVGEAPTRSSLEDAFLSFLEAQGLPRPEINARIGPYEVDCLWHEQRLIVELDSRAHHRTTEAFETDRERDRVLSTHGYRVIRITWRQLHCDAERLAADLRTLLYPASPIVNRQPEK